MKRIVTLFALTLLLTATSAPAADYTSAFDSVDFIYSYTVTPAVGDVVRSFHIYTQAYECDVNHYYDVCIPAGWFFDCVPFDGYCLITWWTDGDPLVVGETATFCYTHYCLPCCSSWYLGEPGVPDGAVAHVDGDENHTDTCNIPVAQSDQCFGDGLVVAPSYPVIVGTDADTWGSIKGLYR